MLIEWAQPQDKKNHDKAQRRSGPSMHRAIVNVQRLAAPPITMQRRASSTPNSSERGRHGKPLQTDACPASGSSTFRQELPHDRRNRRVRLLEDSISARGSQSGRAEVGRPPTQVPGPLLGCRTGDARRDRRRRSGTSRASFWARRKSGAQPVATERFSLSGRPLPGGILATSHSRPSRARASPPSAFHSPSG